jgi:hypothetical protein
VRKVHWDHGVKGSAEVVMRTVERRLLVYSSVLDFANTPELAAWRTSC